MDLDRQAIERRDFPIARRGYDPAAVDSHLRALAAEFEELQRKRADGAADTSLATSAGAQVQSILAAAEAAAADIERDALQSARTAREDADLDAAQTRERAIEHARSHGAAIAQATSVLLERVGSMDGEIGTLIDSVRAGADRLARDLGALESNMGDLYDAASRSSAGGSPPDVGGSPPSAGGPTPPAAARASSAPQPGAPTAGDSPQVSPRAPLPPPLPPPASVGPPSPHARPPAKPTGGGGEPPQGGGEQGADLDSARLVALNMALNGEPRAKADRYLDENFQLADRQKLIDEVYAAIEG